MFLDKTTVDDINNIMAEVDAILDEITVPIIEVAGRLVPNYYNQVEFLEELCNITGKNIVSMTSNVFLIDEALSDKNLVKSWELITEIFKEICKTKHTLVESVKHSHNSLYTYISETAYLYESAYIPSLLFLNQVNASEHMILQVASCLADMGNYRFVNEKQHRQPFSSVIVTETYTAIRNNLIADLKALSYMGDLVEENETGLPPKAWSEWSVEKLVAHFKEYAKKHGKAITLQMLNTSRKFNQKRNPELSAKISNVMSIFSDDTE